ncbi:FAD/FMN-containing dehydrogenase/Fe-S oxidoreductase [Pseudacidovorax sp. 1753]|uniref:D-2-hydroxyglutarate dehydrogenase YdiJ n=1 Tax=Pseudacidovorax sp. 1753 TaxID=3156419 RepID=UPI00339093E3
MTKTVSISMPAPVAAGHGAFLRALQEAGFQGEIGTAHGERTVQGTDNSIYQRLPQACIYPRDADDVVRVATLAGQERWRAIVLTPRGGGTGTNGQSLTDGIVVDLSRHMNRILHIDPQRRQVRVQAGVVKDQLNAALAPYGLFFAPELSTSNRATLGGMVATDASGQGSCTYGKTRDHVVELDTVLLGGVRLCSHALDEAALDAQCARADRAGEAYRTARAIQREQQDLIDAVFPPLNRCLTGYDLAHLRGADGRFNLNSLLCGAEGSLGLLVEVTLNVLPIPTCSVLVNVRYAGFMEALRDARALMAHRPLSIETVDATLLQMAMRDSVWQHVADYFPADADRPTLGINLVEFSGGDAAEIDARVAAFTRSLRADEAAGRLGHTLAVGQAAVRHVYAMRKRAVGLLGNVDGEARPQPFVEDTAVPPEHLADYIAEFRALLDQHGLRYGMFGHVDAGVLHVRPALDMKDPAQVALLQPLTDRVAALTRKYGGLLWGEHGKGLRSQYAPEFFGPLYPALQQIKAAFDPHNQLNPGKIATPAGVAGAQSLGVRQVALRGEHDRQIDERVWRSYGAAMHCNGNGACYDHDPDEAMCPSWKGTRERVHSPKGRATLMREWLRLQQREGVDVLAAQQKPPGLLAGLPARWRNSRARRAGAQDFSHEVYDAMAGCLACKSCAGRCPVKVSVPEFRARFLALYHQRYQRPARDYLVGSLEFTLPWLARLPGVYNGVMGSRPVRHALERHFGLVDSPMLSRVDFASALRRLGVKMATGATLAALSPSQRARSVVLVQDVFTRYFETPLAVAFIELATRLGHTVYLSPLLPNGKPLHVHGFLDAFDRVAARHVRALSALAAHGVPLVGLDPAMTLVFRQEYRKVQGAEGCPEVRLPQEWLLDALPECTGEAPAAPPHGRYRLLAHCAEKTNVAGAEALWVRVFAKAGLVLRPEAVGCCGMSGTYGHEARNQATSLRIFEQSWGRRIDEEADGGPLLATGYSCRSQVDRLRGLRVKHPIEILLAEAGTLAG